ncbi:MAG TPA: BadF/BadG/BcrA/BcrD ATPase family protein [Stellaceae bacterium]|nr:BadF/BadG/BcrA/BcrD ATPase family protein [Stellaceae bacterium]
MAAHDEFLLGVDGGGTRCRARLADRAGRVLAEGEAGPANLRLGFIEAFAAVLEAAGQCLAAADLPRSMLARTTACLALAGASEPDQLDAARRHPLPFGRTVIITDAEAACVGAHGGADGGIIVIGTGSIGWGMIEGRRHRVGGWGFAVSDDGSGAWLGREAIRRALWAYDGLGAHDGPAEPTPLLDRLLARFEHDPHAIVRWTATATPGGYAALAPLVVDHAGRGDAAAIALMRDGAAHIDALAARLSRLGVPRIALVGGLAASVRPHLAAVTQSRLVPPLADALAGALRIAARVTPVQDAAK